MAAEEPKEHEASKQAVSRAPLMCHDFVNVAFGRPQVLTGVQEVIHNFLIITVIITKVIIIIISSIIIIKNTYLTVSTITITGSSSLLEIITNIHRIVNILSIIRID